MTATGTATSGSPERSPSPRLLGPGYRRLTAGIVVSVLVIAFEAMAVATAMPVAVRALHGLSLYAWGFSAYLTTSLFAMVVSGEWSDRRGPREPFLGGAATFAAGLLVAGTATSMPVFVAGRAVQGLGGGMVLVALYVVIARRYPESLRPRVFSAISAAWVLPSIVGPALAGWAAEQLSWRAVFLGVPPFVALAMVFVVPSLRGLGTPLPAQPEVPATGARTGRKRLALATAAGAGLLQLAGQRLDLLGLALGALGAALLVGSLPRLLPPGTLRARRGLPTTVLERGVIGGAFFGAESFVPLMLVEQRHLSPTLAGLALTGGALGWALGSWFQGRPGLRVPRHRLVSGGALLVAVGICGVALTLDARVPAALAAPLWSVGAVGMGLLTASLSVLVLEQSAPADQGANSAALQLSDGLGSALLIGLAGSVFAALHGHDVAGHGDGTVFLAIYAVMAAVALLGAALGRRVAVPVQPGARAASELRGPDVPAPAGTITGP
jgi:MFS family permease